MKGVFILSTVAAIAVILLVVTGIGATVFITPAYAQVPDAHRMTGIWLGDDGGTYYMRAIKDVVWWVGLSAGYYGGPYSNVFRGTMTTQTIGNERIDVISGEFIDVIRGKKGEAINSGKLLLRVDDASFPRIISKISGGFATEKWTLLGGGFDPPNTRLTGVWQASDGGTYYLRQDRWNVWWIGMSGGNDGRSFSNVFHGEIKWLPGGVVRIMGEWVDVPRGATTAFGTLDLRVVEGCCGPGPEPPKTLQTISQTGGFGPTTWKKVR